MCKIVVERFYLTRYWCQPSCFPSIQVSHVKSTQLMKFIYALSKNLKRTFKVNVKISDLKHFYINHCLWQWFLNCTVKRKIIQRNLHLVFVWNNVKNNSFLYPVIMDLKIKHKELLTDIFFLLEDYHLVSKKASTTLIQFSTLCKLEFCCCYANLKCKTREINFRVLKKKKKKKEQSVSYNIENVTTKHQAHVFP